MRKDAAEGKRFVAELLDWLRGNGGKRQRDILKSITSLVPYPGDFQAIVSNPLGISITKAIELLAEDTVRPFEVKNEHKRYAVTLTSVENGFCSILERGDKSLAYLPTPTFKTILAERTTKAFGSCGSALLQMIDAVTQLQDVQKVDLRGKAFEKAMTAAVLLYTRGNKRFSPAVFCSVKHTGKAFRKLELIGGDVRYEEIHEFPPEEFRGTLKAKHVRSLLVNHFPENCSGAILVPGYKFNLVGDYYGVFRSLNNLNHIVFLVFQNKDWFWDVVKEKGKEGYKNIIDAWRERREMFPKGIMNIDNFHGQNVTVEFLFILQSANAIEMGVKVNDNEGIGNIVQMREWNPTAAFACENAMHMRKLFSKSAEP